MINTSGTGNTFLGIRSGNTNVSGTNNTCVGLDANVSVFDLVNATALGDSAIVNASHKIRLGNEDVTVIEGQVDYSFPSDARFKYDITDDNVPGLDLVNKLHPVQYRFDTESFRQHITGKNQANGNSTSQRSADATLQTGFLAQEVEQACEEMNYSFSGLHKPESNTDNYSLSYASFVPILVKSIQEQQEQMKQMLELIVELQHEIQDLKGAR